MNFPYQILVFIHVLSAIGSIGPFFILLSLVKRISTSQGSVLDAYINTFQFVVRFTKHSGHVLVFSGVLLVLIGPWTLWTSWIIMTLVVMFLSIFFLARAFTPTLKKLQEKGHDRAVLTARLNRTLWNYIFLLVAMLWFMVIKPSLW